MLFTGGGAVVLGVQTTKEKICGRPGCEGSSVVDKRPGCGGSSVVNRRPGCGESSVVDRRPGCVILL